MTELLVKLFVGQGSPDSPDIRKKYGTLAGICGIILNIILCGVKLVAGIVTGAISVTADAVNNLSDAGSSVVTLFGARLATKRSDSEHPFGHGRIEYVAGLIVSFLIILLGFELFSSSISRLFNPIDVEFAWISVGILVFSILVKFWMWHFNRTLAKRISSTVLAATATDSLSDCISTSAVLIGLLLGRFFGIQVDGYIGIAVAVFIMISGIKSAKDTIDPLLGTPASREFIKGVRNTVMSFDDVIGMHDLIIHNYGPNLSILSLHAELPSSKSFAEAHDIADKIEMELEQKFNCEASIHVDPIDNDNPHVVQLRGVVADAIKKMDERLSIHDFRICEAVSHTNIIFDVVVPHRYKLTDEQLIWNIKSAIHDINESYFAVIKIDHDLSGEF